MTRSEEHDSAVRRLEAVLIEQNRALVGLRAAGDQVAARKAWLHWVDDESYRGLNAGPFELLAQSLAAQAMT